MPREEQEKPPHDRLQFREVRDQRGRLLLRISRCGVIEVKPKHGEKVLVNVWEYLEEWER